MSAESHNSVNFVAGKGVIGREFSIKVALAVDKTRRILAKKMGPPRNTAKIHGGGSRNLDVGRAILAKSSNCVRNFLRSQTVISGYNWHVARQFLTLPHRNNEQARDVNHPLTQWKLSKT
jgi:hypothetical protein